MEMLELKRWDGLCRIMINIDLRFQSFWACVWPTTFISVSPTIEKSVLSGIEIAQEMRNHGPEKPCHASLGSSGVQSFFWIPKIALDVKKWPAVSKLQAEHVDLTHQSQPGPTPQSKNEPRIKAIEIGDIWSFMNIVTNCSSGGFLAFSILPFKPIYSAECLFWEVMLFENLKLHLWSYDMILSALRTHFKW